MKIIKGKLFVTDEVVELLKNKNKNKSITNKEYNESITKRKDSIVPK